MRILVLSGRAAGLVAIGLLFSGCVAAGSTTPAPAATTFATASPAASTAPPEATAPCVDVGMTVDYGPYTIAGMYVPGFFPEMVGAPTEDVAVGATIVVATVTGEEAGIFNTRDGSTPRGFGARPPWPSDRQESAMIYTPVDLQVERTIRGDVLPGALRAVTEGGTVGCSTFQVDDGPPRVEPGRRYVLFLSAAMDADGQRTFPLQEVEFAWPIDAEDVVQTVQGPMALVDLVRAIDQAAPDEGPATP
jgi:hypothetical protein